MLSGKTVLLSAKSGIPQAAEMLRAGGTVAFPTETVYGLGSNAVDATAVAKIFAAKERPGWDPVIVHVCDREMLERVAEGSGDFGLRVKDLMEAFWPGPLTLLLPRTRAVPDAVASGRPLVGVRMPAHPVALELIRTAGVPVAAPSANRFGRTSPTTAAHVLEDLDGRIDAVLDGGATTVGVESTVLDVGEMLIYRPGAGTAEVVSAGAGGGGGGRGGGVGGGGAGGGGAPATRPFAKARKDGPPASDRTRICGRVSGRVWLVGRRRRRGRGCGGGCGGGRSGLDRGLGRRFRSTRS